jgi:hypothetical protein
MIGLQRSDGQTDRWLSPGIERINWFLKRPWAAAVKRFRRSIVQGSLSPVTVMIGQLFLRTCRKHVSASPQSLMSHHVSEQTPESLRRFAKQQLKRFCRAGAKGGPLLHT